MTLKRSVVRRPFVAALMLLLVLAGPVSAFAAFQATGNFGQSPAQDHAEVIAQGVSAMPANEVAWRVVTDEAEPNEEAEPENRALGFALATGDPIVINDLWDGSQKALAPGEASFVADGTLQHRASLTDNTVDYARIALVSSDQANDNGGDQLVFAGNGFAAPDGNRDIDLLRDVLKEDETTAIDDSGFPVLIYVTEGELEVNTEGDTQTLKAGEAAEFSGELDFAGLDPDQTAFVAAVLGGDVPAPPRFSGTVTVEAVICPSGVTADDITDPTDPSSANCQPIKEGLEFPLVDGDDKDIAFDKEENHDDGLYLWSRLSFGTYTVGEASTLPDGYGDPALYDANGDSVSDGEVSVSRDNPDAKLFLYYFTAAGGTVKVTVMNCDPDVVLIDIDPEKCSPTTEDLDVRIELFEGDGQGAQLTLDDATLDGDVYTWTGIELPENGDQRELGIRQQTLPEGYNYYTVHNGDVALPFNDQPSSDPDYFVIQLSTEAPSIELTIYNVQNESNPSAAITVWLVTCQTADADLSECVDGIDTGLTSIEITGPDADRPLTIDNATKGDTSLSWTLLPFGDYLLDPDSIGLPDGYVPGRVDGATLGSNGYEIQVSEQAPDAAVILVAVPEGAEAEPTATSSPDATDTDEDGLTDAEEAELGTDPTSADSDGDCSFDGIEVEAGTDPLDPTSTADCG
jgi:hypothetical protein